MLYKLTIYLLLLFPLSALATHLRSGEITYRPDPSGKLNSYEVTVVVYTNAAPGITTDVATMTIDFGDLTTVPAVLRCNGPKVNNKYMGELVSPVIRKNIFITTHQYAAAGTYIIAIAPSARNLGILNIPASGGALYVASMLTISNSLSPISSPVLSLPPYGDGCANYRYTINPGAVDPDGDVLKFGLLSCKTASNAARPVGVDIPGYIFPQNIDPSNPATFTIDLNTGTIIWDKPTLQGEYNIAFKIEKWRNNVLIGYVIRDMQITITPCLNNPPVIKTVPDMCVIPGKTISYDVSSFDIDNDSLAFVTTGMPYDLTNSPAIYTPRGNNKGTTVGTFTWNTNLSHFRKNPYQVYYKVTDFHSGLSLSDVTSNFITLLAPAVKNVKASVLKRGFNIKWDPSEIAQATGYNIYRKTGVSSYVFDTCTLGVPAASGFSLVGTVSGINTVTFFDDDNGNGLATGLTYCYIVTATFDGGAESSPSPQLCNTIMLPFIKVIRDTLTDCQWNKITFDTTIIQYLSRDPNTTYKWTSTSALEILDATKSNPVIKLISPGLNPLKLIAVSGLYTDSATFYIRVYPIPEPIITYKDLGGMPDSVMFYNKSNNSVRAEWLFEDGTRSSSIDSVLYIFNNNGYFRTYLKVYNILDCPDTTSIIYHVVMSGIAMPNAFEPQNQSSALSSYRPVAIGLQTYFLGIWDLWGNLVWSSDKIIDTRPAEGWTGEDSKGRKLPAQNYIWRMSASFINGKVWKGVKDRFGKYHKEGTLYLLR